MKLPTLQAGYYLVGVSIVLNSCAQLLFRMAMQDTQAGHFLQLTDEALFDWLATGDAKLLALGILLYGSSMLIWIHALSRFAVSLAYPLMSLSYVLVYAGAVLLPSLAEQPSMLKLAGIFVIVLGVFLVAGSADGEASPVTSQSIARNRG